MTAAGGLSARELMRIHLDALFTRDARGRLLRVNEHGGKEAPRFFLGRTAAGSEWRFRADLPENLVKALEAACRDEASGQEFLIPPYGAPTYEELLAQSTPIGRRWAGPAFRFAYEVNSTVGAILVSEANLDLLRPHLTDWHPDALGCQPALMLLAGSRAVSICCSVRKSPVAHEAGVETAPEFRGRGLATGVVTAWADAVRRRGLPPLYSTSWQNPASLALAETLGLQHYGTDLHFT